MILVAVPALLVAGASLAAFFGGWWWPLDLLTAFRPQYAALLAALGVVLLVAKWRRVAAMVLLAGAANVAVVAPMFIPSGTRAASANLRIVSFNLFASNESFDEVVSFVQGSGADLVFLHEASRPWEEALAVADLDYEIVRTRSEDLIFGTLVLHRGGAEVTSRGFSVSEPRAVEVSLAGVDVLAIHPLAPTTAARAGLRDAQMQFAADWAAARPGPRIVVGDFNATPWSHSFRALQRIGELENSQRGYGLELSFPASGNIVLRIPIDHLLYGGGIDLADRSMGPSMGSDHFPLTVDLAVPD